MQNSIQRHCKKSDTRECFVVANKTMPNYFSDYDTTVHFISEEELKRDHSGIPHGGFVIRSGKTGWNDENNHVIEYSLKLDSIPVEAALNKAVKKCGTWRKESIWILQIIFKK